jgi:hypothetical protein
MMKHSLQTIEKMRRHRHGTDLIAKFWDRVDKNGPVPAHGKKLPGAGLIISRRSNGSN